MAGQVFTDQLGRPLEVGARVVPVDAIGAVLWSRSGRVVGLGRALVHVQWSRERYTADRRYHAVPGNRFANPGGVMITIGLVGCAAAKLSRPAPARELYISQLFRKAATYAEEHSDRGSSSPRCTAW